MAVRSVVITLYSVRNTRMSDNPVQIDFNGIGEPEPGFAKFQEQTKITVNAPRTDKQKLDSALKRVGELTNLVHENRKVAIGGSR